MKQSATRVRRDKAISKGLTIEEMRTRSMILDVGAKIQAVYMAAAAMDLSCVARTGFDARHVERILRLQKGESVVAIQTIGYHPKSILDTVK